MVALPNRSQPEVLIVEDEPRYREMLLHAVADLGFEVEAASSAEHALRLFRKKPFGIVVLDLDLPGMNGLELLEQIRTEFPGVEAIILTGFGNLAAARKAIHLEVVDFIIKPCQLNELDLSLSRARARRMAHLAPLAVKHDATDVLPDTPTHPPTSLEDVERDHILTVMKKHKGNRQAVASELGISLRTLYNRLLHYRRSNRINK